MKNYVWVDNLEDLNNVDRSEYRLDETLSKIYNKPVFCRYSKRLGL